MKKSFRLLLLLLGVGWAMAAQGQAVKFTARANATQVVKDGLFEVTFKLENASGEAFVPPSFEGFKVFSGPAQAVSRTIINGNITQSFSFSYQLKALKTGTFSIGAATIRAENKLFKTNPLKIEVVKGAAVKRSSEPHFLKVELSDSLVYVGQQVTATISVYSQQRIIDAELLETLKFADAYVEPVLFANEPREGVAVLNGRQYNRYILQRYAIFPQREGVLNVNAVNAEVSLVGDLFGTLQRQSVDLLSNPVRIRVRTLSNKPSDYSGGVGRFNLEAQLTNANISTDETANLVVTVVGTGDMKALEPLDFSAALPSFEVYPPETKTELGVQDGVIIGQKVMSYVLSPKKAGTFTFTPSFTYFDTQIKDFVTLKADEMQLQIRQGTGKNVAAGEDFSEETGKIRQAHYFSLPTFFGQWWFWAAVAGVLLVVFLVYFFYKKRKKTPQTVKKTPQAIASEHLQTAKKHLETSEKDLFYKAVSKALLGYVSERFEIPQAALSKDTIAEKLEEKGVEEATAQQLFSVLAACDLALFAGGVQQAEMEKVYTDAKAVIEKMEKAE